MICLTSILAVYYSGLSTSTIRPPALFLRKSSHSTCYRRTKFRFNYFAPCRSRTINHIRRGWLTVAGRDSRLSSPLPSLNSFSAYTLLVQSRYDAYISTLVDALTSVHSYTGSTTRSRIPNTPTEWRNLWKVSMNQSGRSLGYRLNGHIRMITESPFQCYWT